MIRILHVPPGEAPEEVRRAWVGLSLPVAYGPVCWQTAGAISGSLNSENTPGFAVLAEDAVRILEESNPKAAAWWKNTLGDRLRETALVFGEAYCEPAG